MVLFLLLLVLCVLGLCVCLVSELLGAFVFSFFCFLGLFGGGAVSFCCSDFCPGSSPPRRLRVSTSRVRAACRAWGAVGFCCSDLSLGSSPPKYARGWLPPTTRPPVPAHRTLVLGGAIVLRIARTFSTWRLASIPVHRTQLPVCRFPPSWHWNLAPS